MYMILENLDSETLNFDHWKKLLGHPIIMSGSRPEKNVDKVSKTKKSI